mmetsp:Transcript_485/g.1085  ORF Transcript_485/g.1085 Transcript_485/m.1085 type:complete len:85 (-) Transcript_485:434-688(-)
MMEKLLPTKSHTTSMLWTEQARPAADQNTNNATSVLADLLSPSPPPNCLDDIDVFSKKSSAEPSGIVLMDLFSSTIRGSSNSPT